MCGMDGCGWACVYVEWMGVGEHVCVWMGVGGYVCVWIGFWWTLCVCGWMLVDIMCVWMGVGRHVYVCG